MTTISEMLVRGFGLTMVNVKSMSGIPCALCGGAEASVAISELISNTTAEIPDTFRHGRYACAACAACFREPVLLTGSIMAVSGAVWKPLISRQNAAGSGRPCWSDLLRTVPRGIETTAIITLNTKRRLWPRAVVSEFSERWQPLFVDGACDRVLNVRVDELLGHLDLIEQLLTAGFSKLQIGTNLLTAMKPRQTDAQQLRALLDQEAQLAALRNSDAFLLALFVAQASENEETDHADLPE